MDWNEMIRIVHEHHDSVDMRMILIRRRVVKNLLAHLGRVPGVSRLAILGRSHDVLRRSGDIRRRVQGNALTITERTVLHRLTLRHTVGAEEQLSLSRNDGKRRALASNIDRRLFAIRLE